MGVEWWGVARVWKGDVVVGIMVAIELCSGDGGGSNSGGSGNSERGGGDGVKMVVWFSVVWCW